MRLDKTKVVNTCDKISLFSIYAVLFFLPISKGIIESFTYIAIACLLVKKIVQRQDIPHNPINLAAFAYLLICFFSIFNSSNMQISAHSFLGKILQNITFFFAVADTLNTQRRLKNALSVLFASCAVVGIDGIYQHFTHKDFIRQRPDLGLPRIYASFGTPNDLGCYLVAVIPFTLCIFFTRLVSRIYRAIAMALFWLLFICIILTVSRGAWFGFIAVAIFFSSWFPAFRLLFVLLVFFLISTLTFFPPYVKERLSNLFIFLDHSGIDRKMIWQAAWKMFATHPLFGMGLGTFMFNFESFVSKSYIYSIPYAHNCYLQMASEVGIIGLVAFLLIIGIFFFQGIRSANKSEKSLSWYILLGSIAAILGYCIQISVDTFLYSLDLGILFWSLLGVGVAAQRCITCSKDKSFKTEKK